MGSDPEKLFPFELMLEHFRKYGKIGLIQASIVLAVFTKEVGQGSGIDDAINPSENKENVRPSLFISDKSKGKFEQLLRDVIVDMVAFGYI